MTKAMMSGCIPVVTKTAALTEKVTYAKNLLVNDSINVNPRLTYDNIDYFLDEKDFDIFVNQLIEQLKTEISEEDRKEMSNNIENVYDWNIISNKWKILF